MNMKDHILAGLQEQFTHWDEFLAGMEDESLTIPHQPSKWTIKDEVVHLWAWQQRSIARVEAALAAREPDFPKWLPGVQPDNELNIDLINDWIYQNYMALPWSEVHKNWMDGFTKFLELGDKLSERDLLDESRYKWMKGSPLALVLIASYDHHQEHYDKMVAWLEEHGEKL